MPVSVLCVHPSSELYGSDRSFASALRAISRLVQGPITVRLPEPGEISSILPLAEIELEYGGMSVLRKATLLRDATFGIFSQVSSVFGAMRDLSRYDIVYVNTCVVVNFLLAGAFKKANLIVHIREIPNRKFIGIFRSVVIVSGAKVIFNSFATKAAFRLPERVRQAVVYNGYSSKQLRAPKSGRDGRALRVLCIGRLNSWKGQGDLISACAKLNSEVRSELQVRIVGGVYGDQHQFRENLAGQISESGLSEVVSLEDFRPDPSELYRWADVVVVPSREPEPFGRVAIEAMAHGCAVLAYGHGGLTEIVVDGETGILVEPRSIIGLSAALASLAQDQDRANILGEAGLARFEELFTEAASQDALIGAMRALMD